MRFFVFLVVLMAIFGSSAAGGDCVNKCGLSGSHVCGKDGKDYPNECLAKCEGNGKEHDGTCVNDYNTCKKDCDHTFNLVCGKDGQDYPNECYAKCGGTEKESKGPCPRKQQ